MKRGKSSTPLLWTQKAGRLEVAIPLKRGKSSTRMWLTDTDNRRVAIPLKRGKSSTLSLNDSDSMPPGRNPLEAGQKFNLSIISLVKTPGASRNPLEAGQKFNELRPGRRRRVFRKVAIPLKRGKSSTKYPLGTRKRLSSRNPLEAGQKFNSLALNKVKPDGVAIPLKRGKSSTVGCDRVPQPQSGSQSP